MEIREAPDGRLQLTGYASTTETPYQVGSFRETIAKGAFRKTLSEGPDVVLLIDHAGLPLARTKSGTLTLSEDVRGLRVDASLDPRDPDVARIRSKVQRGDLGEMPGSDHNPRVGGSSPSSGIGSTAWVLDSNSLRRRQDS